MKKKVVAKLHDWGQTLEEAERNELSGMLARALADDELARAQGGRGWLKLGDPWLKHARGWLKLGDPWLKAMI